MFNIKRISLLSAVLVFCIVLLLNFNGSSQVEAETIAADSPTCTDSDNGKEIYTKGKVYGKRLIDPLDASKGYQEYKTYDECSGSGKQINEMWCYENPTGEGKAAGKMVFDCDNGCANNACIKEAVECSSEYVPVCGKNNKTYSNECVAKYQNNIEIAYDGECKKDIEIKQMEEKSELLSDNKIDVILGELRELRSLVKEQQTELKYLRSLVGEMSKITGQMQSAIKNFITYGIDDNTKRLGEGERAAVIYSYKNAFGKLPEYSSELSDVVKIANGRWPENTNEIAEKKAKDKFKEIYKREMDVDNERDDAAVVIMAYGLRQSAQNRNLNSERNGIKIFKDIYNKLPNSTEDWNIVQAITYSGSKR